MSVYVSCDSSPSKPLIQLVLQDIKSFVRIQHVKYGTAVLVDGCLETYYLSSNLALSVDTGDFLKDQFTLRGVSMDASS